MELSTRPVEPAILKEVIHDQHIATISKMPYVWTSIDTRNALVASVIPVSLGVIEYLQSRPGGQYKEMFENLNKPKWLQYPAEVFGALDVLTMSPLGYLSYLVYKNGQGFSYTDTSVALGLYGLNLVQVMGNIVLFQQKNVHGLAISKTLTFLVSVATTIAFYKVDEKAGIMYGLYSLMTGGAAFAYCQLSQMNKPKRD